MGPSRNLPRSRPRPLDHTFIHLRLLKLIRSSLRCAEKIIRCLQDNPLEAERIILLSGEKSPDGVGGSRAVVAVQSRIHPTGRKEYVARSLNFGQQVERRLNVLLGLRGSERMVEILQAFEHPRLAPTILDVPQTLEPRIASPLGFRQGRHDKFEPGL